MLSLALAVGSSVAARRAGSQPSQCRTGENVVYSCRFGAAVGSLCGSKGKLSYRFGPPGRPAIDIASDARWSNVRTATITGSGGFQHHIRFTRDGFDYIVFYAIAGQYAEVPNKSWSGIHVGRGDRDVRDLACRGRPTMPPPGLGDLDRFLPAGVPSIEEPDDRYNMWY